MSEVERGPLAIQTNILSPIPSSDSKKLRRKESFVRHIDSSEDVPSPHDSIFEAEYLSNLNSEDSDYKSTALPVSIASLIDLSALETVNDESLIHSAASFTSFRYGLGTALSTITEQKSSTTMRTADTRANRPRSLSDAPTSFLSTSQLLGHKNSFDLKRYPRISRSFTTDDLDERMLSYKESCKPVVLHKTQSRPQPIQEIYAQPQRPVVAAIQRPSSPDGLPSWIASQNGRRQGDSSVQNRLQKFFGIESRDVGTSPRIGTLPAGNGSTVRPISEASRTHIASSRARPLRFRPIRSGHGAIPLEQHPFMRNSLQSTKEPGGASVIQPYPTSTNVPEASSQFNKHEWSRQLVRLRNLTGSPRVYGRKKLSKKPVSCPHGRRDLAAPGRVDRDGMAHGSIYQHVPNFIGEPSISSTLRPRAAGEASAIGPAFDMSTEADQSPAGEVTNKTCWKCRVSHAFRIISSCWETTAVKLCWICCGVDTEVDGDMSQWEHASSRRGDTRVRRPRIVAVTELPSSVSASVPGVGSRRYALRR